MTSKLNNFKGKRHVFSKEDSKKGGKRKTSQKVFRSQTNPIKKDKITNVLKDCNSCSIPLCPFFEEEKQCSMFNTKFVRLVSFKKNLSSIEDFDAFMFNFFQRGARAQTSDSYEEMRDFLDDLLEYQEWKHESNR